MVRNVFQCAYSRGTCCLRGHPFHQPALSNSLDIWLRPLREYLVASQQEGNQNACHAQRPGDRPPQLLTAVMWGVGTRSTPTTLSSSTLAREPMVSQVGNVTVYGYGFSRGSQTCLHTGFSGAENSISPGFVGLCDGRSTCWHEKRSSLIQLVVVASGWLVRLLLVCFFSLDRLAFTVYRQ